MSLIHMLELISWCRQAIGIICHIFFSVFLDHVVHTKQKLRLLYYFPPLSYNINTVRLKQSTAKMSPGWSPGQTLNPFWLLRATLQQLKTINHLPHFGFSVPWDHGLHFVSALPNYTSFFFMHIPFCYDCSFVLR